MNTINTIRSNGPISDAHDERSSNGHRLHLSTMTPTDSAADVLKWSATIENKSFSSNSNHSEQNRLSLPSGFQPTPCTVIIGRSRLARQHPGNFRLRSIAKQYLREYSRAQDKRIKSSIVTKVIEDVQQGNRGIFVKQNKDKWEEVDDAVAREKIGYIFRDLLSDKYRSSSKSKTARRQRELFGGSLSPPHSERAVRRKLLTESFHQSASSFPTSNLKLFDDEEVQSTIPKISKLTPLAPPLYRSHSAPLPQAALSLSRGSNFGAIPDDIKETPDVTPSTVQPLDLTLEPSNLSLDVDELLGLLESPLFS